MLLLNKNRLLNSKESNDKKFFRLFLIKFRYAEHNSIWSCGPVLFCFFLYFFFSPQPPERTQMFVTSRLLEMGFSMRHIYWAMEAAGTAL